LRAASRINVPVSTAGAAASATIGLLSRL
jgi:hypothetical protein